MDAPRDEGATAFVMTDQSLSMPVGKAGSPTVMACLGLTGLRKVHCDPANAPSKAHHEKPVGTLLDWRMTHENHQHPMQPGRATLV